MKTRIFIASFIFCILLAGCASTTQSMGVLPPEDRTYSASYEKVYGAALETAMALDWQILDASKDDGLITAKVPMNMLTNEDRITILLASRDNQATEVKVSSSSPQLIDWGKGEKNIREFYNRLSTTLKQ